MGSIYETHIESTHSKLVVQRKLIIASKLSK